MRHRADVERRRSTLRAARDLTVLLQECAGLDDFDAVVHRVATSLTETLDLRGCWFEAGTPSDDLPELLRNGEVTTRVHLRLRAGLVLPPLTALPVRGPNGSIGRFVLESDPDVGLSLERRTLAVAMAHVAATASLRG